MALQKPYNISLKGITIDANEDNEVTWQVSGDIQTAYKIDVLFNSDNTLAWTSNRVADYGLKCKIPHGSLINGIEYKIIVTIYNQANQSITSDGDIFQTSSRPVVRVDPIDTVNSFSYNFSAQYHQNENVPLRTYVVNLYDSKKNLLSTSGIRTSIPLEYLFTNLQTEQSYYIEFIATSSKGLIGKSGLILFSVFYYRPKMNVYLDAKNNDKAGISLSWYIRQIIGHSDGSKFIDSEKIDTTDGTKVWFDEGFSIDSNFTLKLWLESVPSKKDLLILTGENGKLILQYDAVLECFVLTKSITNGLTTIWTSNTVEGNSFFVCIQQINTGINLSAEVIQ